VINWPKEDESKNAHYLKRKLMPPILAGRCFRGSISADAVVLQQEIFFFAWLARLFFLSASELELGEVKQSIRQY
jgi:hypothetical protein